MRQKCVNVRVGCWRLRRMSVPINALLRIAIDVSQGRMSWRGILGYILDKSPSRYHFITLTPIPHLYSLLKGAGALSVVRVIASFPTTGARWWFLLSRFAKEYPSAQVPTRHRNDSTHRIGNGFPNGGFRTMDYPSYSNERCLRPHAVTSLHFKWTAENQLIVWCKWAESSIKAVPTKMADSPISFQSFQV